MNDSLMHRFPVGIPPAPAVRFNPERQPHRCIYCGKRGCNAACQAVAALRYFSDPFKKTTADDLEVEEKEAMLAVAGKRLCLYCKERLVRKSAPRLEAVNAFFDREFCDNDCKLLFEAGDTVRNCLWCETPVRRNRFERVDKFLKRKCCDAVCGGHHAARGRWKVAV